MDYFFFFQAEDGIRDLTVTGVQTCALPILLTGRTISHYHPHLFPQSETKFSTTWSALSTRRSLTRTRQSSSSLEKRLMKSAVLDRKSTRLNSSHSQISYAVFCLKKKNN